MRWRWLGMSLVALAVVLAAPIGVSFGRFSYLSCPAPSTFPPGRWGDDDRMIMNGVLVRYRHDDGGRFWWKAAHPNVTPFDLRWSIGLDDIDVRIPIWPMPLVIGAAGLWAWRRGSRAVNQQLPQTHPVWLTRRTRSVAIATGVLGLAFGSLVIVSFLSSGGVRDVQFRHGRHDESKLEWGLLRGAAFASYERDWLSTVQNRTPAPYKGPRVGPLSAWWTSEEESWSLCVPAWPLPLLLLCGSGVLVRRNERSLLWALRGECPGCGYAMGGLSTATCPECGRPGARPVVPSRAAA